jgi:hypothetical protein
MEGACRTDDPCADDDNVLCFAQSRSFWLWRHLQWRIVAFALSRAVLYSSNKRFVCSALVARLVQPRPTQKRDAVRSKPRYDVGIVFDLDFAK